MENTLSNELILAAARILIPVLVSFVASLIGAFLLAAREFVISKLGEVNYKRVVGIVRSAVLTAEANGLRGAIENVGAVKKAEALALIKRQLAALKLSNVVPEDELAGLVEAAVLDSFNFTKLFPAAALTVIEETPTH